MSTLKFTGIAQARKRNTSYDIAVENGFVGDEQAYEIYTHGLTVAQVTLYKRATSAPNSYQTDGGTNVTYTFSNGNISFAGSDAGWHTSPYTDDGDLYVIYASASSKDTYDTILPSEWSTPAIMSEEAAQGEPGNNVCVVLIYNASAGTPSLPSAETQFTFSTGDIIGLTNGWVKSPPSGDKVWVSTAIAMSQEQSARISASAWSAPNIWKEKGVGLSQPTEEYAVNNSTTTPPSSGWTTFYSAVAQLDANHRYVWNRETMNYTDGSHSQSPSYHIVYRLSTDGTNAKNIIGIDEWYAYGDESAPDSSTWSNQSSKTPSELHPYVWQRERVIFEDQTYGEFATAHVIAMWIKGDTGVSVTSIVDQYAVNNSSSTAPSSGWDSFDNVKSQLGPNNRFMWNREIVYYDGVPSQPLGAHIIYRLSTDGIDAKNIIGVEEWYAYGTESAVTGQWGQSPISPDVNNPYVWQKERVIFEDQTYGEFATAHIISMWIKGDTGATGPQGPQGPQGPTGAAGADAQVFDFKMSSQIFVMNLRLTGYSQIDLESIVQGYQGVNILWTVTGGTFDPTSTTPVRTSTVTSPMLFIPYTTSANITITLEDTTSGSTIDSVVKTLTVNDETSYGHNYGLLASAPTVASSPRLIYAPNKPTDFYTDSTDGVTYEYTMVGQTITWKASDDATKLLDGLALIKKADPPIDLNDPAYSNSNGVALFTTILAEKVIARVIKALQLEVGTEDSGLYVHIAESNGNKIFVVKYNGTPIFTIDSEGQTSMVRATMDNASMTGNGSSFYSDVFKTTRANSSSGTVNKDYTSLDWYYKLETDGSDSLAYAFWAYVVENGTDETIYAPPERAGHWKRLSSSGYYNGTYFQRVYADPDIPRSIGDAVVGVVAYNDILWLEYNTARTTIVNQSVATYISGVQIDKANYKQGWLLTASFISSLNLPYNFSMKVTGGYATVNNGSQTFYSGSTLTLTSSSITLSGSGNPVTLTAGTYVQPFGFYGMTVETSRDGIATKNIASYDGNTYDVGTTDKPFNFYGYVNGNASSGKSNPNNFKVWGAVFN